MRKPPPWTQTGKCQRCGRESNSYTGSWFSGELICLDCSEVEESHADYPYAKRVEEEAVKRGDLNFPGVGWPGVDGRVFRPDEDDER